MTTALPFGYEVQPAAAYGCGDGRFFCQLNRVYGPSAPPNGIRSLDRGRSFWSISEQVPEGASPDAAPPPRSISFAEAVESIGKRLYFERFCSFAGLIEDLGVVLGLPQGR